MEKTKIIINRKSSFVGSAVKFKVEFNGNKVGEIANGKSIEIETIEGEHKLKISFGKKSFTYSGKASLNEDSSSSMEI